MPNRRYRIAKPEFSEKFIVERSKALGTALKATRQFKLLLPSKEGPGYIHNVAFETFFDPDRRKNIGPQHVYVVTASPLPDVPVIELIDMWDFYKVIGYDHKQRTWACEEFRPANVP